MEAASHGTRYVSEWLLRAEGPSTTSGAPSDTVRMTFTTEAPRGVTGLLVRTVDLTSRADREAANRLYERLGSQARQSTVYRFPFE